MNERARTNREIQQAQYERPVLTEAQQEEADLREFCEFAGVPYIWLKAFIRRMVAGVKGLEKADCVYAIGLAKQNGLPVTGAWYVPIPKTQGEGFTLCFTLDAAYYIISHDDRVAKGSLRWWWTDSKGTVYEQGAPPAYHGLKDIDIDLCCTVAATLKDANAEKQFTCRYSEWVSTRFNKERGVTEPNRMWVKMPAHMLFKQTVKEWVRAYLGASLEYEDRTAEVIQRELSSGADQPQLMDESEEKWLEHISMTTGHPIEKLRAGARDFISSGGDFDTYVARMNPAKRSLPPVVPINPYPDPEPEQATGPDPEAAQRAEAPMAAPEAEAQEDPSEAPSADDWWDSEPTPEEYGRPEGRDDPPAPEATFEPEPL